MSFNGLDTPLVGDGPDFVKALNLDHALDGGYGVTEVAFSSDGGTTWHAAKLGKDLRRYSFREWTAAFTPSRAGKYELKVRAVNRIGQSQPMTALWNPMGYLRNVVETTRITAA